MPKRSSKRFSKGDANQIAYQLVREAVGTAADLGGKNPAAVALGVLGGLKGGRARADSLSPKRRSEIARKAAVARWSRKRKT